MRISCTCLQNDSTQIILSFESNRITKQLKSQGKMNEMRKHEKGLQKGICDERQNDLCA